jgi:hypothetical protein
VRSAPGSPIECWTWCWVTIACTAKNEMNDAMSMSPNVTAANTMILAHSTGSRRGTAIRLERIMPVEYSPVMTRTPRTPIANWARW